MTITPVAAWLFSFLTVFVVLFLIALSLGAPWGEMTMGGKYPGKLPRRIRFAVIIQAVLLAMIALLILTRGGIIFTNYFEFSQKAIWGVVVFCGISAVLNTITPSKKERLLWAPIAWLMFSCSLWLALN